MIGRKREALVRRLRLGVNIDHVATVRQAQQILAVGTLVLIFGGVIGLQALPEAFLASLSYSQAMGFFISVVAVVDAVLLALAFASFRRSRLILG